MSEPSYDEVHGKRFALSLQWLKESWNPPANAKVLEIGWPGTFTKMFSDHFGITGIEYTNFSLSYEKQWQHLLDDAYDLVISMEVMEHLNDPVEPGWNLDRASSFLEEGAKTMLNQCRRILKPAGHMFLTTPNIACWHGIRHLIDGGTPWSYGLHVREYSYNYVIHLMQQAGYSIVRSGTEDCYDQIHSPKEMEMARKVRESLPWIDQNNRWETTFVLAKK